MMDSNRKEVEKKGYSYDEDLERYIKENWIPEEAAEEDRAPEKDGKSGIIKSKE